MQAVGWRNQPFFFMTTDKRRKNGGHRPGSGRKSREELGLPPVVTTTVAVEAMVIETCKKKHGSLANALRYAAAQ